MADKDFKVKNKLIVNGLNNASGVILATNNNLDSHTVLPTQYGGTGTTQSPNAGQVLYSTSGSTYTPTTLTSLDVKGATYSADAPANPVVGQVWIESDSSSDSFDPNIIRRKTITATAGQTTFTTDLSFIQGYEQVYFNGMLLLRTDDYTTPSNTSVVLVNAAAAGDIVEILSITNLNSINAATTTTNTFTGTQVIDTSSSTAALRITQTGTGEALRVEDSSNPDSSPFVIDASGNAGIGTNSMNAKLNVESSGTSTSAGGNIVARFQSNGSGYDSTIQLSDNIANSATISMLSGATIFRQNGGESMRIDSAGNVGIGITNPSYKLHVAGGVGISAGSGRILFNSNNQTLPTSDDGGIVNLPFGFGGNLTGGQAEMNIFNNVNLSGTSDAGKGFLFVQKTGASTYEMPLRITGNGYLYQTDILGARETGLIRNYSSVHVSSNRGSSFLFGMNDGSFAGIGIYNVASTVSGNSQYIAFNTHEGNQTAGERMRIRQNGAIIMGGAANTQHLNEVLSVNHGANVQALVLRSSDASYTTVQGVYRIVRANNSAYRFAQWDSSDGGDTEFYLRGDGQAYADGSWNGGGADYAEYFEWADGNIENEDRVGYSVALVDNKIKIAEEGDTIIGVISGSPSVVGDHASNKWDKKYLKDDFSRYLRDENGDRILNPEYDSELEYVSRESRPEWAIVGLMGKLRLRKGQVTGAGWIKMRDISEAVEEWLVK